MKITEEIVHTRRIVVENYCCNTMKYFIDVGWVTFDSIGFYIQKTHGIGYCPFCGEKIGYK